MPRPSATRYAILGWLSIEPMSGYDLRERIQSSVGMFWNESFGSIYPTLHRLEGEGLIREQAGSDGDHPSRRVMKPTARGLEHLRDWLAQDFAPTLTRNEFAMKIFFGGHQDRDSLVSHIRAYREHHIEGLDRLQSIQHRLRTEDASAFSAAQRLMTAELGDRLCRATIQWCDDMLARLGG
ncbi:MAG: PadR family transcriptional regulator [Planctomycetota bacterium]